MKYVVYEVWTKAHVIDAKDDRDAYKKAEPKTGPAKRGWSLCNWHAIPVGKKRKDGPQCRRNGGASRESMD